MKKTLWILFFLVLIIGISIFIFKGDNNNQDSYIAKKTVTETQKSNDISKLNTKEKEENKKEILKKK